MYTILVFLFFLRALRVLRGGNQTTFWHNHEGHGEHEDEQKNRNHIYSSVPREAEFHFSHSIFSLTPGLISINSAKFLHKGE